MNVISEQHLVHAMHVRIVGEHDVAGIVEREPIVLHGTAPAADLFALLQQQTALSEMVGSTQAGWTCTENHRGVMLCSSRRRDPCRSSGMFIRLGAIDV